MLREAALRGKEQPTSLGKKGKRSKKEKEGKKKTTQSITRKKEEKEKKVHLEKKNAGKGDGTALLHVWVGPSFKISRSTQFGHHALQISGQAGSLLNAFWFHSPHFTHKKASLQTFSQFKLCTFHE